MLQQSEEMVRRIAIFRALYLGDMLCIIPTARAIRKAFPQAEIYLVGLPWQKEFVARFTGYFDHFIEFPGWPGLPEQGFNTERIIAFLQQITALEFDIVFQMQGNGVTTNVFCALWNGKQCCGLRRNGEYCPDEQLFPVSEDDDHEVLRFLKLADALGIPKQGMHLEFPVFQQEEATFRHIAETSAIRPNDYICIHPGARDPRRRWPVDNFAFVANKIAAQGHTIVLTGSMDEREVLNQLEAGIEGHVVNIVERFGHLSVGELACVIRSARLLVSNDTGVSHIASALAVESVILFSKYSAMQRWRPLNESLHATISHEHASDREYVLEYVMNKLAAQTASVPPWK